MYVDIACQTMQENIFEHCICVNNNNNWIENWETTTAYRETAVGWFLLCVKCEFYAKRSIYAKMTSTSRCCRWSESLCKKTKQNRTEPSIEYHTVNILCIFIVILMCARNCQPINVKVERKTVPETLTRIWMPRSRWPMNHSAVIHCCLQLFIIHWNFAVFCSAMWGHDSWIRSSIA